MAGRSVLEAIGDDLDRAGMSRQSPQPVLSFEEALNVLQGMFADWPRPALAEMLQANQLNMELTVESVLALGAPPPGLGEGSGAATIGSMRPTDADVGQGRGPSPFREAVRGQGTEGRRGHPITLPPDFLQVPGKAMSAKQQLELDEQLALMLQDELFLQELRRDMPEMEHRVPQHLAGDRARAGAAGRGGEDDSDSLAQLKKSIGGMGDTMKRRIHDMYSRFAKAREGARDRSHVPLMDAQDGGDDDEGEVLVFSNEREGATARRRDSRGRSQELELGQGQGHTHASSSSSGHLRDEDEDVVIESGSSARTSGDRKKLV